MQFEFDAELRPCGNGFRHAGGAEHGGAGAGFAVVHGAHRRPYRHDPGADGDARTCWR